MLCITAGIIARVKGDPASWAAVRVTASADAPRSRGRPCGSPAQRSTVRFGDLAAWRQANARPARLGDEDGHEEARGVRNPRPFPRWPFHVPPVARPPGPHAAAGNQPTTCRLHLRLRAAYSPHRHPGRTLAGAKPSKSRPPGPALSDVSQSGQIDLPGGTPVPGKVAPAFVSTTDSPEHSGSLQT